MIHFEWESHRQSCRRGFRRAFEKMNHLATQRAGLKEVEWSVGVYRVLFRNR